MEEIRVTENLLVLIISEKNKMQFVCLVHFSMFSCHGNEERLTEKKSHRGHFLKVSPRDGLERAFFFFLFYQDRNMESFEIQTKKKSVMSFH